MHQQRIPITSDGFHTTYAAGTPDPYHTIETWDTEALVMWKRWSRKVTKVGFTLAKLLFVKT